MLGCNLYSYCSNNPINYIDHTGHAWYHWAIGAAIVAACAIAVVATAGGAAPAIAAVASVANGVAAATTASTIAAGAFVGSATVYGTLAATAALSSNSIKEFNDSGNWGTVAATGVGAVLGGANTYLSIPKPEKSTPKTPVIGKMNDLNNAKLGKNEFRLSDLLPDKGNPKANWKQNASVLRLYADGHPIRDVSPYPMQNAGFLGAERNLLSNRGYQYVDGIWIMP